MSERFVVAVDQFADHHVARIAAAAGDELPIVRVPEGLDEAGWVAALAGAVGVAGWPPPDPVFDSPVRLLVCGSAGYDAYAASRLTGRAELRFCTARGLMAGSVAEHGLAGMLALSRRLTAHIAAQSTRDFTRRPAEDYREVAGDAALIVGLGDIGLALARRCQALGLSVTGVRRHPTGTEPVPTVGPDRLAAAARSADQLFLTVPGGPQTDRLLDADVLAGMKSDACVHNLSRGSVLDEAALLDALHHGRIGGAALDVFADEPLPADSPWWTTPNTLITPHVGGRSRQFADRFSALVADNLAAFRAGRPLVNEVDLHRDRTPGEEPR